MTVYPARGPRYRQLPLWRDAQRLLLEVEQAVRGFSRYHKYSLGSELRQQTMNICRLVARAAQEQSVQRRLNMVEQLDLGGCSMGLSVVDGNADQQRLALSGG